MTGILVPAAGSQAPRLCAAAARPAAACPSGDRATHNAASSAVAKLPRAWAGRDWRESRRSSLPCSWPRAASAPPPVPAAAPPRSSALQPASPLPPAPLVTARRTAPPPRRWRRRWTWRRPWQCIPQHFP
eukprot:scaffold41379_cov71-Phaeocystis_antarctica.AAC.5